MATVIFFIFVFVWYFPVWKVQGKEDKPPKFTLPVSFIIGAIPASILSAATTIGLALLNRHFHLSGMLVQAYMDFIGTGLVEEFFKFLGGYLVIRYVKPKRQIDYILILGTVGMGFEVSESLLSISDIITSITRGAFALHIIWQFWMGMYFWKYQETKKANRNLSKILYLFIAFVIPVLLHGFNDFLVSITSTMALYEKLGGLNPIWILVALLFLFIELIYQIITFVKVFRISKASAKQV